MEDYYRQVREQLGVAAERGEEPGLASSVPVTAEGSSSGAVVAEGGVEPGSASSGALLPKRTAQDENKERAYDPDDVGVPLPGAAEATMESIAEETKGTAAEKDLRQALDIVARMGPRRQSLLYLHACTPPY